GRVVSLSRAPKPGRIVPAARGAHTALPSRRSRRDRLMLSARARIMDLGSNGAEVRKVIPTQGPVGCLRLGTHQVIPSRYVFMRRRLRGPLEAGLSCFLLVAG